MNHKEGKDASSTGGLAEPTICRSACDCLHPDTDEWLAHEAKLLWVQICFEMARLQNFYGRGDSRVERTPRIERQKPMTADVLPLVKPDVRISRIRLSIEKWDSNEFSFNRKSFFRWKFDIPSDFVASRE
ncbi:MAG: hypothetical protein GX811_07905 [Lentisphaerae bacterium]|nr:hypothetical protein [Lentisphaerota bacterium]